MVNLNIFIVTQRCKKRCISGYIMWSNNKVFRFFYVINKVLFICYPLLDTVHASPRNNLHKKCPLISRCTGNIEPIFLETSISCNFFKILHLFHCVYLIYIWLNRRGWKIIKNLNHLLMRKVKKMMMMKLKMKVMMMMMMICRNLPMNFWVVGSWKRGI